MENDVSTDISSTFNPLPPKDLPVIPRGVVKCPVHVVDSRSAKRLLSRVIWYYEKGEIAATDAKVLAYLLQTFVSVCQSDEIEERLKIIENKTGVNNGTSSL